MKHVLTILSLVTISLSAGAQSSLPSFETVKSVDKSKLALIGRPEDKMIPVEIQQAAINTVFYSLKLGISEPLCAGSLVEAKGKTHLLTAFHCVGNGLRDEFIIWGKAQSDFSAMSPAEVQKRFLGFISSKSWEITGGLGIWPQICQNFQGEKMKGEDDQTAKRFNSSPDLCTQSEFSGKVKISAISQGALSTFVVQPTRLETIASIPWDDFAILEIELQSGPKIKPLKLAPQPPASEEALYSVGFPSDVQIPDVDADHILRVDTDRRALLISKGYSQPLFVNNLVASAKFGQMWQDREWAKKHWRLGATLFAAKLYPGMSGGPVLNAKGEIVSVVSGNALFDSEPFMASGPSLLILSRALETIH